MSDLTSFLLRLPADLKAFVALEAQRTGKSQNSLIIRAVRERMERAHATETQAQT